MPLVKEREYRKLAQMISISNNKRIDSNYYVEGYAATYEPYILYEDDEGPVYERFERDCFAGCDMSDVIMQYDHTGSVMARQRNKTLIVEADEHGLFICADLSKSEAARNLYEEISNGLVDRMSWAFIPREFFYDKDTRTLVHKKVKKIFDVSAVSIPANDGTNINARSLIDGEIEKVKQELLERKKKEVLLKMKLGGF